MHNLLGELRFQFSGPSALRIDNQSAIAMSKNLEHHRRIKHPFLCLFWI
jgi:hypothetical protein